MNVGVGGCHIQNKINFHTKLIRIVLKSKRIIYVEHEWYHCFWIKIVKYINRLNTLLIKNRNS